MKKGHTMRSTPLTAVFTLLLLMAGCTSAPDIVSTDKAEGEAYSADEIRRRTVDQPFLLSGDFFRERERDPETTLRLGRAPSDSAQPKEPASQPAPQQTGSGPAPEKAAPSAEPAPPSPGAELRHPIKITMIFDQAAVSREVSRRVRSLLATVAPEHPVLIADPEKVEEMLAAGDCLEQRDLRCIARRLGIYPGVRMLMLVESLQRPDSFPGPALARISLVDTGLGYRYPPMEISATVERAARLDAFIEGVLHQVLAFAVDKSRIMPWFCRAFSTEEDRLYASAGKRSGLKAGDTLAITMPGKLVTSPTGLPAGWVPGEVKGKVRVDVLFGEDFAVCSPVEGTETLPGPDDLLMVP